MNQLQRLIGFPAIAEQVFVGLDMEYFRDKEVVIGERLPRNQATFKRVVLGHLGRQPVETYSHSPVPQVPRQDDCHSSDRSRIEANFRRGAVRDTT